jgi:hypothetical protein
MNNRISRMESGHRWIPPAGLERSRPRLVKLTASGKFVLALAIALGLGAVAAAAGLSALAGREAEESRLLQKESLVTEGQVTRLWRSGDKGNQPWVAYQFASEGRVYVRNAKLPLRAWRDLRVGSYLPVRYVSSRPEINHPDGYARGPLPPWVPVLVAVALAACSFLATVPTRSQSRLLSSGRASPGLVTAHGKTVRTSHGTNLGQQFAYEFPLLSGAISKGKGGPSKNPPAIGSNIAVLYDPDNPRKNAPYPLPLVRLPHTSTR